MNCQLDVVDKIKTAYIALATDHGCLHNLMRMLSNVMIIKIQKYIQHFLVNIQFREGEKCYILYGM
jgi:hypothetical protein